MAEKPQTESGYAREDTELVESATLTVATILGDLLNDLCIVGGLVPTLLIDVPAGAEANGRHCGTNDLDVGMALAILDEERYKEIAERLRRADFVHDTRGGNPIVQRWRWGDLDVTIDFLIPPTEDAQRGGQIKHLEGDFGAIVAPGLQLAFDEREPVGLDGTTLEGDRARRSVPVCGPGAYTVLKSFALRLRRERKDAYDLDYVLAHWPAGIRDIAIRLVGHAESEAEIVATALGHLRDDYATIDHLGPRACARFRDTGGGEDAAAADAQGRVADLLRACTSAGVRLP
ncbi:MAG: hypothetical protein ACRDPC_02600 [Solirubrobacteraceae bacterium]